MDADRLATNKESRRRRYEDLFTQFRMSEFFRLENGRIAERWG